MGAMHVRRLHAEGAKVIFTAATSPEAGLALAAELGSAVHFVRQDVRREEDWLRVVATAEERFGPVAGLVNNAAIVLAAPLESMTLEMYMRVIEVNQVGAFLGMKTVAPSMRRNGGGSIINVSSIAGLVAARTSVAYGASKFALTGMTKAAAFELGPANIRVNTIYPGAINTRMTDNAAQLRQNMLPRIPLGRVAESSEVSELVLFLLSDESGYCTGGDYAIDGGYTAT
jgi:3alpha(or 20beta)-hydroxysteroid dehydrogenase